MSSLHRGALLVAVGCLLSELTGIARATAGSSSVLLPGPMPSPSFTAVPLQHTPAPIISVPVAVPVAPRVQPTAVPLTADPARADLAVGGNLLLHTRGVWGNLSASVEAPQIADVAVNQDDRTIYLVGRHLGTTILVVSDQRGMQCRVPLAVVPLAGRIASATSVRITGSPASAAFVVQAAAQAAQNAATAATGAQAKVALDAIRASVLDQDEISDIQVPVSVVGPGLFPVSGVTLVHVENVAQPSVKSTSLIVSDYPERLTASGLLIRNTLTPDAPTRMLFYHYNPPGQPDRRIILRATNPSAAAVTVQVIDGHGGPNGNEMMVGHAAVQRFLVHASQNEGYLVTVPAQSTLDLVNVPLPAGTIVNDLLQMRQIDGDQLALQLSVEESGSVLTTNAEPLIALREHHARGVYPIPQFFYEATYVVGSDVLRIPVGQLPLPNLRQGEALVGDYGVQWTIDATLTNPTNEAAAIALYANPRGGRATGTFLIDRALVQAHALPSFSTYKLRQYLVPPHGIVNVQVVTIPEGGSSYPLDLIFGPDDGSVAPNTTGSLVY